MFPMTPMKLKKLPLYLLLSIGLSCTAVADFSDGLKAYEKQDYATAINEFLPLAEQSNADSQHFLGHMYSNSLGVLKDDKQAVYWYTKAAEQGNGHLMIGMIWLTHFKIWAIETNKSCCSFIDSRLCYRFIKLPSVAKIS